MLTGNKKPTLLAVNAAISKPVLCLAWVWCHPATGSKISFFFPTVRFSFSALSPLKTRRERRFLRFPSREASARLAEDDVRNVDRKRERERARVRVVCPLIRNVSSTGFSRHGKWDCLSGKLAWRLAEAKSLEVFVWSRCERAGILLATAPRQPRDIHREGPTLIFQIVSRVRIRDFNGAEDINVLRWIEIYTAKLARTNARTIVAVKCSEIGGLRKVRQTFKRSLPGKEEEEEEEEEEGRKKEKRKERTTSANQEARHFLRVLFKKSPAESYDGDSQLKVSRARARCTTDGRFYGWTRELTRNGLLPVRV